MSLLAVHRPAEALTALEEAEKLNGNDKQIKAQLQKAKDSLPHGLSEVKNGVAKAIPPASDFLPPPKIRSVTH
jgi:hypothetical protein